MPKHGGFAAAVQIREHTLRQFLTILHRGKQIPNNIAVEPDVPNQTGPGSATLKLNLYVPAPIVDLDSFLGARLFMRLVGSLQIEAVGIDNLERQVALDLVINTDVTGNIVAIPGGTTIVDSIIKITGPSFNLVVSITPNTVMNSIIEVLSGPPLPAAWQAFFSSVPFRAGVGIDLNNQLANVTIPLPTRFAPVLQALQIGLTSTATVTAVIRDEFVTFGVDILNPTFFIPPTGNPAEVENFLSKSDIALAVDKVVAPLIAEYARQQANMSGAAEITQLSLAFENQQLKLAGHLEVSVGNADFTLTAKPMLGRPEWVEVSDDEYGQITIVHEATDEIWMDVKYLDVDADLDWGWYFVMVVGALASVATAGAALPLLVAFIGGMAYGLYTSILIGQEAGFISEVEGQGLVLRRQRETMAGNIVAETFVTALQVFPDRIQSRLRFTPDPEESDGILTGPTYIDVRDLINSNIYTLTPSPMHFDMNDPELRVRWQLRRLDTNEIFWTVEVPPGPKKLIGLGFSFVDFGFGSQAVNDFKLSVRVYRAIIGEMFDLLNRSLDIHIIDRLDRNHPFVRWQHKVGKPDIEVLPNGDRINHGLRVFMRKSKLHRTDYRRCFFVQQFTTDITNPEYLDELPFDEKDLSENRVMLCDYCFWGGPDKLVPLPLP